MPSAAKKAKKAAKKTAGNAAKSIMDDLPIIGPILQHYSTWKVKDVKVTGVIESFLIIGLFFADVYSDYAVTFQNFFGVEPAWFAISLFILLANQLISAFLCYQKTKSFWRSLGRFLVIGFVYDTFELLIITKGDLTAIDNFEASKELAQHKWLETVFESFPQLCLQSYVTLSTVEFNFLTWFSVALSMFSISWGLFSLQRHRTLKLVWWIQVILFSFTTMGVISRILVIILFAEVHKGYMFLMVGIQYLLFNALRFYLDVWRDEELRQLVVYDVLELAKPFKKKHRFWKIFRKYRLQSQEDLQKRDQMNALRPRMKKVLPLVPVEAAHLLAVYSPVALESQLQDIDPKQEALIFLSSFLIRSLSFLAILPGVESISDLTHRGQIHTVVLIAGCCFIFEFIMWFGNNIVIAKIKAISEKFIQSCCKGDWKAALENLAKGADVNMREQSTGRTALMLAVKDPESTDAAEKFLRADALRDLQDNDGRTALMFAIMNHNETAFRMLLKIGSDAKVEDNDLRSATTWAVKGLEQQAIKDLMDAQTTKDDLQEEEDDDDNDENQPQKTPQEILAEKEKGPFDGSGKTKGLTQDEQRIIYKNMLYALLDEVEVPHEEALKISGDLFDKINHFDIGLYLPAENCTNSTIEAVKEVLEESATFETIESKGVITEQNYELVPVLFDILRTNSTVTTFTFKEKWAVASQTAALVTALSKNTTLKNLILDGTRIGRDIAKLLPSNASLEKASFNDCGLSSSLGAVFRALGNVDKDLSRLTFVDFSKNCNGRFPGQDLASFIEKNSTVTTLILADNCLGEASLRLLCGNDESQHAKSPLAKNSTLRHLDLSGNDIRYSGLKYLAGALLHNTTLQTINLSRNHVENSSAFLLFPLVNKNSSVSHIALGGNSPTVDYRALCRFLASAPHLKHMEFHNLKADVTDNTYVDHHLDKLEWTGQWPCPSGLYSFGGFEKLSLKGRIPTDESVVRAQQLNIMSNPSRAQKMSVLKKAINTGVQDLTINGFDVFLGMDERDVFGPNLESLNLEGRIVGRDNGVHLPQSDPVSGHHPLMALRVESKSKREKEKQADLEKWNKECFAPPIKLFDTDAEAVFSKVIEQTEKAAQDLKNTSGSTLFLYPMCECPTPHLVNVECISFGEVVKSSIISEISKSVLRMKDILRDRTHSPPQDIYSILRDKNFDARDFECSAFVGPFQASEWKYLQQVQVFYSGTKHMKWLCKAHAEAIKPFNPCMEVKAFRLMSSLSNLHSLSFKGLLLADSSAVSGGGITDCGMVLANALPMMQNLKSLNLRGTGVKGAGAFCIAQSVMFNPSLTTLDISENSLGTEALEMIFRCANIKDLSIDNVTGWNPTVIAQMCSVIESAQLESLSIQGNRISIEQLVPALSVSPSLKSLDITENVFKKESTTQLFAALSNNKTLTSIAVGGRTFEDDSLEAMSNALPTTAIESLSISMRKFDIGIAKSIQKVLLQAHQIKSLKFGEARIPTMLSSHLATGIKNKQYGDSFNLECLCDAKDVNEAICDVIFNNTTLTRLTTSGIRLNLSSIGNALRMNNTLQEVGFKDALTEGDSIGQQFFAAFTQQNTTLLEIQLEGNPVDSRITNHITQILSDRPNQIAAGILLPNYSTTITATAANTTTLEEQIPRRINHIPPSTTQRRPQLRPQPLQALGRRSFEATPIIRGDNDFSEPFDVTIEDESSGVGILQNENVPTNLSLEEQIPRRIPQRRPQPLQALGRRATPIIRNDFADNGVVNFSEPFDGTIENESISSGIGTLENENVFLSGVPFGAPSPFSEVPTDVSPLIPSQTLTQCGSVDSDRGCQSEVLTLNSLEVSPLDPKVE